MSEIVKDSDLNIVDLPGIENYFWASKIEAYLEKHQDTVIPLFVIDLTQGAFDLAQFNYIKYLFRNSHGLKVPFVFTKFNNLLNDITAKMECDGTPLTDIPEEDQVPTLLTHARQVLLEFKTQIERVFNDVVYFIYDPSALEGYQADTNMNLFYSETSPTNKDTYEISMAHLHIRDDLNKKFLLQVQATQVTRQIS